MSCSCPNNPSNGPIPINLSDPPSNCSQSDTKFRDTSPEYKGPLRYGSMMITPLEQIKVTTPEALQDLSTVEIPDSWSWAKDSMNGNNMIEDGRRNQKNCGSCWAFGVASVLGDRYAIKYKIAAPYPSVTNLISCAGPNDNTGIPANIQCRCGGDPFHACKWLEDHSIKNSECWPYTMVTNNEDSSCNGVIAPNCPKWADNCCADCCNNEKAQFKFSISKGSTELIQVFNGTSFDTDATIRAIKQEIMGRGPVVTTIRVPNNLQTFWITHKENYNRSDGLLTNDIFIPGPPIEPMEGHALVLTGWGRQNNIDYWEVRNSWGYPSYFFFAMTTYTPNGNECGIDVPVMLNGNAIGGPVMFTVGPLIPNDMSKYILGKGTNKPIGSGWSGDQHKTTWTLLFILIGVLLAIILIALII